MEIARRFPARVVHNKNRDTESGLSLGILNSRGEALVFLGADCELGSRDWLDRMVRPLLEDPKIFGVKCSWLIQKRDPIMNRYCMHLQIIDPLARHLDAQGVKNAKKRNGYLVIVADKNDPPLIGIDFLWRKDIIFKVGRYVPKFEEANSFSYIIQKGFSEYAEVPSVGIHHHHIRNLHDFIRKRIKIGRKFFKRVQRKQITWVHRKGRKKFLCAVLFCSSLIGPAIESVQEYRKTKDVVWFLHPLMCFLTVATYAVVLTTNTICEI